MSSLQALYHGKQKVKSLNALVIPVGSRYLGGGGAWGVQWHRKEIAEVRSQIAEV